MSPKLIPIRNRVANPTVAFLSALLLLLVIVWGISPSRANPSLWNATDFSVNDDTIIGFSATGLAKVAQGKIPAGNDYTDLTIPSIPNVTTIGANAFQATGITKLTLSSEITTVKGYAFADNPLTEVIAPNVKTIEEHAFRANKLTKLVLPEINTIDATAFSANGRVVAVETIKTGVASAFSKGDGHVVNPVSIVVRMVDDANGLPAGDGTKILGTNYLSDELYPAGSNATITAPGIVGWEAVAPTTKTITVVQGVQVEFRYKFVSYDPIFEVYDRSFITGFNGGTIDEAMIRSWISPISGVDGVTPIPNMLPYVSVSPTTISTSSPGSHNVAFVVNDGAGNIAYKSITVTIGPDPMLAYIGSSNWQYQDFEYDNTTLLGLSVAGRAKYDAGLRALVLPGHNPATGMPMIYVADPTTSPLPEARTFQDMLFTSFDFSHMHALEVIDFNAFRNCSSATSIVLDNPNLIIIESKAFMLHRFSALDFSKCPELTQIWSEAFASSDDDPAAQLLASIVFDNPKLRNLGFKAFDRQVCSTLDFSKLPELRSIGSQCFRSSGTGANQRLTTIVFDNPKFTRFHWSAFQYQQCETLDFSKLPALEQIDNRAFQSSGTASRQRTTTIILDNPLLREISYDAFAQMICSSLDFSKCPALETIGDGAFAASTNAANMRLASITFDNPQLVSIGVSAFDRHMSSSLDFSKCPELVTIGDGAFLSGVAARRNLSSIVFDNPKLKTIGDAAFDRQICFSLDFTRCPELETIGENAFRGSDDLTQQQLASISFNNPKLAIIGAGAFRDHQSTYLDFSSCRALVTIGNNAFRCSDEPAFQVLSTIILSNPKLETIGNSAFDRMICSALDFSACPELVSIGNNAFRSTAAGATQNLRTIIFDNPKLESIGQQAFIYHQCETLDFSKCPELVFIGYGAFRSSGTGSRQRTTAVIFDNPKLTTIELNAFLDHRCLELDFSKCPSLESIGESAFHSSAPNASTRLSSLSFDNNPALKTIGVNAFANSQLVGILDMSSCTSFQSFGNPTFGSSPLSGIVIGAVTDNTTGNIYNLAPVPGSAYLTSFDLQLPLYILNNTAGITSNFGYRIDPVNLTLRLVDNVTGNQISFNRTMLLSGPLTNYSIIAPPVLGWTPINSPQLVTTVRPTVPSLVEQTVEFRYTQDNPNANVDWAAYILSQTCPRPYAKIGNSLLSTVKLAVSGATQQNTLGHKIEIYYDLTRVDASQIVVSPGPYTVDTSTPGKVVLTLTQNITSGNDIEPSISWRLIPGVTEEKVDFPLYAQFCKPNNDPVLVANSVALSGYYDRPILTKFANGDPYDDAIIDFGRTNPDGSYTGSLPKEVTYTFKITRLERLIESYTFTDRLPEYTTIINGVDGTAIATFNPLRNPGWVANGDGTVSYTRIGTCTMNPYVPPLILEFPDAKTAQSFTNSATFTAEPYRMAATEKTFKSTDTVRNMLIPFYMPLGTFIKLANAPENRDAPRTFYDTPEDKGKVFSWRLCVAGHRADPQNPTVHDELPPGEYFSDIKLKDDNLDPRMRYVGVEVRDFIGARVTAYAADGSVLFDVHNQYGRVVFPTTIRNDIAWVEITDSILKIYGYQVRYAVVLTELRDPSSVSFEDLMNGPDPFAIDGSGVRFQNTGHMTQCIYFGSSNWGNDRTATWIDEIWLQPFEDGIGISKRVIGGANQIAGEPLTWSLALEYYDETHRIARADIPQLRSEITNVVIRDVLPEEFIFQEFVPDRQLRQNSEGLSWRVIAGGYSAGGLTLDVLEITATKMRPAMVARASSLGEIRGTISSLVSPNSVLVNHVYMDFVEDIFVKRGPKAFDNTTGFNPNPFGSDQVVWDQAEATIIATKLMVGQKEIRAKEGANWGPWTFGVLTDPGGDFQYRLRVRNNTDDIRSNIVLIDVFPHVGDVGIDVPHDPRMSQFYNTLASTNAFNFYLNGVLVNNQFIVEYLLTPLPSNYATLDRAATNAFLNSASWTSSISSGQLGSVVAVRLRSTGGLTMGPGQELNVIIDMKAPTSFDLVGQKAWNTFVRKDSHQTDFLEMPPVYNELKDKLAEIKILKRGANNVNLPGAVFGLYIDDGTTDGILIQTQTTNGSGEATFTGIERGNYYIREITAPAGYVLNTTTYQVRYNEFTDPNPQSYLVPYVHTRYHSGAGSTPIPNTLAPVFGNLRLQKLDGNGQAFAGVRFTIRKDTAPYETYNVTTDQFGRILLNEIPAGTYTITEQASSGRLMLLPPFKVTVAQNTSTLELSSLTGIAATGGRVIQNGAIQIDIKNDLASARILKLGFFDDALASKAPTELTATDGLPLGGVTFTLHEVTSVITSPYTLGPVLDTGTTSTSNNDLGSVTFSDLVVGRLYALKEVAAPPRYQTLETPLYFRVDARGLITTENGTPFNLNTGIVKNMHEDAAGTLVVDKKDQADPLVKLTGAQFTLEKFDPTTEQWVLIETLTTDSNGFASVIDLKWGTYRLTEVAAPDGYVKLPQQRMFVIGRFDLSPFFSYSFDNTKLDPRLVKGRFVQTYETRIPSQAQALADAKLYFASLSPALPTQEVLNTDGTTTLVIGLSGAVFEMKEYTGASVSESDLVGTWTLVSGADGMIALPGGFVFKENNTYTFREVTAPAGYVLDSQIITWRPAGEAGRLIAAGGTKWLVFSNLAQTHRIVVSKTAADTKAPLAGAQFTLLYPDTTPVTDQTLVSDAAGRIELGDLPAGTYYLKELAAPAGYQTPAGYWKIVLEGVSALGLGSPNHFQPDLIDNGTNLIHGQLQSGGDVFIRVTNYRNPVDIEFDKLCAQSGQSLAGAVFELRTFEGASLIATATSDASGIVRFVDIAPDIDGFRLVETEAPAGYTPSGGWWQMTIDVQTGKITSMTRHEGAFEARLNEGTGRWEIVNNKDTEASLTLKKTVIDAGGEESFTFRVSRVDGAASAYGAEAYTRYANDTDTTGVVMVTDEDGLLTLKSGQRATFEGLSIGSTFLIEELSSSGYRTRVELTDTAGDTSSGSNPITVTLSGSDTVHFINTRTFGLPLTGGSGLSMTIAVSFSTLALAALSYLNARRGTTRSQTMMTLLMVLTCVLLLAPVTLAAADTITVDTAAPGSLTINKYLLDDLDRAGQPSDGREVSSLPAGASPLSGITFQVRRIEPARTTTPASAILTTLEDQAWVLATTNPLDVEVVTGSDGKAIVNGLARGYYLVVEKPSAKVADPVLPFIVAIPTTIAATSVGGEDTIIYDVIAYPKNMTVSLDKTLEYKDGSTGAHDSLHVGDEATWLIVAGIPSRIATAQAYQLIDTFSEGLAYVQGSTTVSAAKKLGGTLDLVEGTDYYLVIVSDNTLGGGSVTVDFTQAGRTKLAECFEVRLRLSTVILESAKIAHPLHNSARLVYTNDSNYALDPDYELPPAVHTGGVRVLKVDDKTKAPLSGAVFKVVAKTSSDFAADYTANGFLQRDGADYTVTTGSDGIARVIGLSYGGTSDHETGYTDYWLVEVIAPAGYAIPANPAITIRIDKDSYKDAYVKYTILNAVAKSVIPPVKPTPDPKGPATTPKTGDVINVLCVALAIAITGITIAYYRRNGLNDD